MRLLFIYGLPATGKLTVAKELAAKTGYKLFHNHLVVDLLLSTFEFGSESFVELREEIWLSVFDHACKSQLPGLIFTFNPETTVWPDFVERTMKVIGSHGGHVDFIQLTCPLHELKSRIDSPSRREYGKLTSLAFFEELHARGEFHTAHMPKPNFAVDTSLNSPVEAASKIIAALELI